jgi:processive 1,2-diacylglycerol beta-glucosyltransferase
MKKNVLIFYISRYSGHFHAACAIEKAFKDLDPEVVVAKVNALDYTNPILGKILNRAYLEVIKKKPEIWGNMYDNPSVLKKTKKAREALHKYNMSKIKKLIERFSPDAVYCTQAFPCGMVADYKRTSSSPIKLIGVLTDHAPHSYWLHDEVDYYLVPSEDIIEDLLKKGVPKEKIIASGIPIDPKFTNKNNKAETRKELGFSKDAPMVLIMGGSQGLGAVEDVAKSISKDKEHRYQLVIVAGKNRGLNRRLGRLEKKALGKIKVFSYVDNIDELMDAADVIVTKAGGMTTSEALAKELPLVIIRPIPGHEKLNSDFLTEKGAAIEISDFREIHKILNDLFDSKDAIQKMKEACRGISKPESAFVAAKTVLGEKG